MTGILLIQDRYSIGKGQSLYCGKKDTRLGQDRATIESIGVGQRIRPRIFLDKTETRGTRQRLLRNDRDSIRTRQKLYYKDKTETIETRQRLLRQDKDY